MINTMLTKQQPSVSINLATSSVVWPLSSQGFLSNDPICHCVAESVQFAIIDQSSELLIRLDYHSLNLCALILESVIYIFCFLIQCTIYDALT